jgi:hypothetical protein
MFIVPLAGDTITTDGGAQFKVVSYTNYKDHGPAVYVERGSGSPSDPVYFGDITEVNGTKTSYVRGQKVLEAMGRVKRRFHLPQPGDDITAKVDGQPVNLTMKSYKLHRKGYLHQGLMLIAEDDTNDTTALCLDQLIDVRRPLGDDNFSRDRFLSYYDDYRGTNA